MVDQELLVPTDSEPQAKGLKFSACYRLSGNTGLYEAQLQALFLWWTKSFWFLPDMDGMFVFPPPIHTLKLCAPTSWYYLSGSLGDH
jgi:hypothetical protein